MKERMTCVATIVTLTLLVWTLGGGTTYAGGGPTQGAYHIRFAGKGAQAGWTNCPSGPVEPGEVCTDIYVSVAEQMVREDGTRFTSTTLSLSEYRYTVDAEGNWVFVSTTYGEGAASLTVAKRLTGASASATVPLTICTADGDGNDTCVDGGLAVVRASWIGAGDLERSHGTYHSSTPGSKYSSHSKGTSRSATATGQVNGVSLGASSYAYLHDAKSGDIYINHGGN